MLYELQRTKWVFHVTLGFSDNRNQIGNSGCPLGNFTSGLKKLHTTEGYLTDSSILLLSYQASLCPLKTTTQDYPKEATTFTSNFKLLDYDCSVDAPHITASQSSLVHPRPGKVNGWHSKGLCPIGQASPLMGAPQATRQRQIWEQVLETRVTQLFSEQCGLKKKIKSSPAAYLPLLWEGSSLPCLGAFLSFQGVWGMQQEGETGGNQHTKCCCQL